MSVPLPLQTRRNWRYAFANGRWVVVVGLVVLVGLGVALAREVIRRQQVRRDIASVQQEIDGLQHRNEELQGLIGYFQSDAFKELEARKELNVKAPGEKVVEVKQPASVVHAAPPANTDDTRSNLGRWWDYLFGERS